MAASPCPSWWRGGLILWEVMTALILLCSLWFYWNWHNGCLHSVIVEFFLLSDQYELILVSTLHLLCWAFVEKINLFLLELMLEWAQRDLRSSSACQKLGQIILIGLDCSLFGQFSLVFWWERKVRGPKTLRRFQVLVKCIFMNCRILYNLHLVLQSYN